MALKTVTPFPIFAPTTPTNLTNLTTTTSTTEIRFSRWNNANAEKHNNARRTQKAIEDDLRRHRRFESALNITTNYPPNSPPPSPRHHSSGTPSTPSLSSVPGRKSKYSRPHPHPAFRQAPKRTSLPPPRREDVTAREGGVGEVTVCDGEGGLKYVIPGAPFEFMYSYTEAPKGVRAVALREEAVAPFGPGTIPRPWTGRKPMSKKLLPEFDTFKPPPDGKKGVKSVQKPGPYLPGSGPRYVVTREEILGEELTRDEVHDLIMGCRKTKRQLNMGRDGLTHNMLDNIHAHWKRRRVCKIKCKGVCTVDMDNVCQQLEEKAGGKIIYRRGGVVYLFRGRNYNFKTRPRFPLMLWKPITPVFPRLVKSVPEGLTYAEVTEMRKRGHELIPICKLGKNGVYVNLVKTVREAFEVCDLVRINCQGLNPGDYRKIGAKLKDLVPCILLSFKYEHILMCRGKDWRPSLLLPETGSKGYQISESDRNEFLGPDSSDPSNSVKDESETDVDSETCDEMPTLSEVNGVAPNPTIDIESESPCSLDNLSETVINSADNPCERESSTARDFYDVDSGASRQSGSVPAIESVSDLKVRVDCSSESSAANGESEAVVENKQESSPSMVASSCTEGVLFLLKQALDNGSAVILDDSSLDGDVIFEKSVKFSKTAPPGPVFTHRPRKVAVTISENQASAVAVDEAMPEMKSPGKKLKDKKSPRIQIAKDFTEDFLDVVPQGSLKVDELAKLLA